MNGVSSVNGLYTLRTIHSSGLIQYPPRDYALYFDGIDDYIEVFDSDNLDVANELTIEFWLKFSKIPGDLKGIITKDKWKGLPGYYIFTCQNETSPIFGVFDNEGKGQAITYNSMEAGLDHWHYYAFTYDGSKMKGFLDGRLRGSYSFLHTIGTNNLPVTIGCRSHKDKFFNGAIDEVRISKIARSEEEVFTNYNGGVFRELSVDEYTVALWHFNEGSGDSAHDETNNDNDGTIYGARWVPKEFEKEIRVNVNVNFDNQIGTNNLSLGTQFNTWHWTVKPGIPDVYELIEKAKLSNFGLVRIMVGWENGLQPCTNWDEETYTGTYDWTELDRFIQAIMEIGAYPLICIGGGSKQRGYWLPRGMIGDWRGTGFPLDESFGTYCADMVKHINVEKGWNVTYWEIWNEPEETLQNPSLLVNFTRTFNNAQQYMHNVDPAILLGNDCSCFKVFFDYFVEHAQGVGFLSFHKYDAWGTWLHNSHDYYSDYKILKKAGRFGNPGDESWSPWSRYSLSEMQGKWEKIRGEKIPILCSETNLNSVCEKGTDPRIQQAIGAVWYAEELMFFVLSNVKYSVYFEFASDDSDRWNTTKPTKGWGFGMVRRTSPYTEWYPYSLNNLIGNNLKTGDPLFQAISNDTDTVSALAWKRRTQLRLLLISKVEEEVIINITGLPEGEVRIYRIGSSSTFIQSETSETRQVTLDGYTVLLISFE